MENDYRVFNFLNKDSNDLISKMNKQDLDEFLTLLNNYYLEYRTNLGINNNYTFGSEIETEYVDFENLILNMNNLYFDKEWDRKKEVSLIQGIEINSPILKDYDEDWEELKSICDALKKCSTIGNNSGGHIHIGAHILEGNNDYWANMLKLWSAYEKIIYRFTNGEYTNSRKRILSFAKPIGHSLIKKIKYLEKIKNIDYVCQMFDNDRNNALNLLNVGPSFYYYGNTIEVRCPNGTLEETIIQNNINFLIKFMEFSKSSEYDPLYINSLAKKSNKKAVQLELYDEIYLDESIKLADMIFDNNLDKIYFLRQYLKNFEVNPTTYYKDPPFSFTAKSVPKAKTFIKK